MNAPASPAINVTQDINPATGELLGEVANTDMSTAPEIIARAREAQKTWASYSFRQRASYIKKMRQYIVDHADEIATIVSQSNGKTKVDALATEVLPCTLACEWYSKNAERVLKGNTRTPSSLLFFNKLSRLEHLPMGVVGIISPWNYPLSIPFGEVVMGLMAGNAIILKVAAATPLVGKAIQEIVEAAGLPEGLFAQLVGSGGSVSKAFFENQIDKIFFTGSVGVGKDLMKQAAENLTPLSLELGGNDPMIVLADADIERATNGAAWAGYQNAGQSCGGVERIYVHESIYRDFVDLLKQKTLALRHGYSDDANKVDIGSMTTRSQLNTVEQHLEDALANGAKIEAQSQPTGSQEGFFHPATLITDVSAEMLTMREETFGPILPVMSFSTVDQAIEWANDSDLALTSSVWTKNLKEGKTIAKRLESGVTTINDHLYTHGLSELPWGGWKLSGVGRTHGPEGLMEMTHPKVVNWDMLPSKRNLWWYPFDHATYSALLNALRFVFPKSFSQRSISGLKLSPFLVRKMFTKWKPKK